MNKNYCTCKKIKQKIIQKYNTIQVQNIVLVGFLLIGKMAKSTLKLQNYTKIFFHGCCLVVKVYSPF